MQTLRFSVDITSSKQNVWHTLWDDSTFRDWAGVIDEGTHMVGEMTEGHTIEYISASGYGVTSLIVKLVPEESVMLRHLADTMDNGNGIREDEWTGGTENYTITEHDEVTTLTIELTVPDGQTDTFKDRMPKALERVKSLAESKR